jgi:thioredoxin 1
MNEILNGNAELSCDLMSTISLLTNIDINLILKVENKRKINKYLLDKYKNETGIKEFLNRFNINEMIKRKWFRPKQESSLSQIAVDLLEYLQVKDFDNLNTYMDKRVLYKKRDDADLTKIYLWITRCDILIKDIKINEYMIRHRMEVIMVKKISQNEFNEVTASEVAVIDFSATWCGPCKMLAPVLEEVSEEYAGKVNFFNVDVDENPDLAMQYKIMNIPALVVLKKGEKVDTQVGFAPKENIVEFIKKQL